MSELSDVVSDDEIESSAMSDGSELRVASSNPSTPSSRSSDRRPCPSLKKRESEELSRKVKRKLDTAPPLSNPPPPVPRSVIPQQKGSKQSKKVVKRGKHAERLQRARKSLRQEMILVQMMMSRVPAQGRPRPSWRVQN